MWYPLFLKVLSSYDVEQRQDGRNVWKFNTGVRTKENCLF
jgi:hypothetical protein